MEPNGNRIIDKDGPNTTQRQPYYRQRQAEHYPTPPYQDYSVFSDGRAAYLWSTNSPSRGQSRLN